jgi:hypothetical protein
MRKEELKIGEYYYYEWKYDGSKMGTAIIFCKKLKIEKIYGGILYIHLKEYKKDYMLTDKSLKRLATPEEIYWYKLCEIEDKYVDKPIFKYKLGDKVMYEGEECEVVDLYLQNNLLPTYIVTYSNGWKPTWSSWQPGGVYNTILSSTTSYNYANEDSLSKPLPHSTNFDNCKIWIGDNPELSRKVQERLFELEYKWRGKEVKVQFTDKHALYTTDRYTLLHGSSKELFEKDNCREIYLSDLGIIENKEDVIPEELLSMVSEWNDVKVVGDTLDDLLIISKPSNPSTKYIIVNETKPIMYEPVIIKNKLITI